MLTEEQRRDHNKIQCARFRKNNPNYQKKWYLKNKERHNLLSSKNYLKNREKVLVNTRKRYLKQRDIWTKRSLKIKEKYPIKWKARQDLRNAIAQGKIKRLPCQTCGNPKSHGHHHDYSKPFDVLWLCSTHHGLLHRRHKIEDIQAII